MAADAPTAGRRRARIALALAVGGAVAGVTMTLNTLKFGHPLDSGYMHVYEGRAPDEFSRDAHAWGLFSVHYVPRNLYYMNYGPPNRHDVTIAGEERVFLRPNRYGTGIWWTTPLLLWLIVDFRRILRDSQGPAWLAGAALVVVGLMLYHSTGYQQRGFNRYSLDFVPVLMSLVAARAFDRHRAWISAAMIAWSVVYFRWLI